MDKVYRRKEVAKLSLNEFQESKQKEIWDIDYLTTSEEEDNDTEEDSSSSSSDSSDNEHNEKSKDT